MRKNKNLKIIVIVALILVALLVFYKSQLPLSVYDVDKDSIMSCDINNNVCSFSLSAGKSDSANYQFQVYSSSETGYKDCSGTLWIELSTEQCNNIGGITGTCGAKQICSIDSLLNNNLNKINYISRSSSCQNDIEYCKTNECPPEVASIGSGVTVVNPFGCSNGISMQFTIPILNTTGECPSGQIKCSDGVCRTDCGTNECPSGTTLCSDGTCKEDCGIEQPNYSIYIIIFVLVLIVLGLGYIYLKSTKKKLGIKIWRYRL